MAKLNDLSRPELFAVVKKLDKDIDLAGLDNSSVISYLRGKYQERTIDDMIKLMRKNGELKPSAIAQNLEAAGLDVSEENDIKTNKPLKDALNKSITGTKTMTFQEFITINKLDSSITLSEAQKMFQDAVEKFAENNPELQPPKQHSVKSIITEFAQPKQSEKFVETPPNKFNGKIVHGVFEKALRMLKTGENILLVGPGGSGKTTLSQQLAEALNVPYYFQSLTGASSEAALSAKIMALGPGGSMCPVIMPYPMAFAGIMNKRLEDGTITVIDAPEKAGLYLGDEIDAMDPNAQLVLNAPLANGKMTIEALMLCRDNPVIVRSKSHYMVGSANTFGSGTNMLYSGRGMLDGAFLDRFYIIQMGYDPILEAYLGKLPIPDVKKWQPAMTCTDADERNMARWVLKSREIIENAGMRKLWGSRAIIKACAARRAGIPAEEVKRDLTAGWPADLVAKLLAIPNG